MTLRKKPTKPSREQLRAQLNDAINRGELGIQDTVKEMRKISRLTQPEFAKHRGVSAKVIKDIERGVGNPTVNTLNQIGAFFGLEVAFVHSERLRALDGQIGQTGLVASTSGSLIGDLRRLVDELEAAQSAQTSYVQDT